MINAIVKAIRIRVLFLISCFAIPGILYLVHEFILNSPTDNLVDMTGMIVICTGIPLLLLWYLVALRRRATDANAGRLRLELFVWSALSAWLTRTIVGVAIAFAYTIYALLQMGKHP
jgi:hypothetical protein